MDLIWIWADEAAKYGVWLFQMAEKRPWVAPFATATIGFIGALTAIIAIHIQRDVARRRAAIDFFMKTDLDPVVDTLYRTFRDTTDRLVDTEITKEKFAEYIRTKHYKDLKQYLNIMELCATGVKYGALSRRVTKAYWGDWLPVAYKRAAPLIRYMRITESEGDSTTYQDLEWLARKWGYKGPR